jgi:hypothetical protein
MQAWQASAGAMAKRRGVGIGVGHAGRLLVDVADRTVALAQAFGGRADCVLRAVLGVAYGNAVAAFGLERTEFERCAAAPTIGLARMRSEVFFRGANREKLLRRMGVQDVGP